MIPIENKTASNKTRGPFVLAKKQTKYPEQRHEIAKEFEGGDKLYKFYDHNIYITNILQHHLNRILQLWVATE